ncbi:MAG: transglycosylase SLT domain-containing protein, partial [Desulfobacterales bacterium]
MKLKLSPISLCVIIAVVGACTSALPAAAAADNLFPRYPCIQPNVAFWKKIYSEYSSDQGVIHDKQNLEIIYEVVDLVDSDRTGSQRMNRQRIKMAKKKYAKILAKLGRGELPTSPEEQRVADIFGPDATRSDFRRATHHVRCQIGQKDRFREGVIRSGAYLEDIKGILRAYGIPADLAYLPHVESSFEPRAYSKFGAAGIWQFTRSTARLFMQVD